jgi:branched-chain amino acid transport system substrate-binding protein
MMHGFRGRKLARRHLVFLVILALAAAAGVTAAVAAKPKSVTNYVAYVGGKAGKANSTLSPIKVGYVNQEGGPIVIGKTADNGVQAAVAFVNKYAGGIGGHPIVLVQCFIASSEEQGQTCGQKFANDKQIVAVVSGAIAIGNESLYSAIGGKKPVIVGVSVNPVDVVQANAAVLYGDARYIVAPYATFAKSVLHVKSAAIVFAEGAGLDSVAAGETTAFQAAGIEVKKVSYPADTADLSVPLVAAGAANADLVVPVINPNDCGKFAKAIRALNIPENKVLASPICLTPGTIQELGDFPQWIYGIATSLTIDRTDPAVPPYQKILTLVGQQKLIGDPWTNVGFGEVLTLVKWLRALGPSKITSAGIIKQMKAFRGPLVLGSPVIHCGRYKAAPGVCNVYSQFYYYKGKGVFTKAGDWVPPPKGWVAPKG